MLIIVISTVINDSAVENELVTNCHWSKGENIMVNARNKTPRFLEV